MRKNNTNKPLVGRFRMHVWRRRVIVVVVIVALVAFLGLAWFAPFWSVEIAVSGSVQAGTRSPSVHRCALLVYGVRLRTLSVGGASVRANIVEKLGCDVFVYGRLSLDAIDCFAQLMVSFARDEEGAIEGIRKAFKHRLKGVFLGVQAERDEILASLRSGPRFAELEGACKDSNMLRFAVRWLVCFADLLC